MSNSDQALENYLKKITQIQYGSQSNHQFSQDELKQIALDAGLTESAWQQSQKQAQQHLQRGRAYFKANNYQDATKELDSAAAMMPHDAETNYLAAQAFLFQGRQRQDQGDLNRAEYYVNRTISIDASHSGAYQLKTELNNHKNVLNNDTQRKTRTGKFTKWAVLIGLAVVLLLGYFSIYNSMVSLEEGVNSSWAQVENQYQRRADLIPNLVETVKGAADYERETLREVVEARAAATSIQISADDLDDAEKLAEYAQAQETLGTSLGRLIAVAEQYPTLTATANFRDLQSQIEGTENRISTERRRFNTAVQNYNARARRFPNNMLGFNAKEYFDADPAAATPPKVEF